MEVGLSVLMDQEDDADKSVMAIPIIKDRCSFSSVIGHLNNLLTIAQ